MTLVPPSRAVLLHRMYIFLFCAYEIFLYIDLFFCGVLNGQIDKRRKRMTSCHRVEQNANYINEQGLILSP